MKYAPLSGLLKHASIKTENQLMAFYDSSWEDYPDTGRSTGAYIIFYRGGLIDHVTYVTGLVSQLRTESNYKASYNSGMNLAHFRMLNN